MIWPLDYQPEAQKIIHKIFIPYACINEIKEMLTVLDVTNESIYGVSDLDDISKEISQESRGKFYSSIEKIVEKYIASLTKE